MKLLSCILVLSIVGMVSCKDDCEDGYLISQNHSFDTVYPSDYLMADPGSFWEYSDGTIDSCSSWVPTLLHESINSDDCLMVNENLLLLPEKLRYHFGSIYFDQEMSTASDNSSSTFIPIIDTSLGVFFSRLSASGKSRTRVTRETLEHLDSIEVNGNIYQDVLVVEHKVEHWAIEITDGPDYIDELYFAKYVGLIKLKTLYAGVSNEIDLVEYQIGPH